MLLRGLSSCEPVDSLTTQRGQFIAVVPIVKIGDECMLTFVCLSGSLTASMQCGRPPHCNCIHAVRSPAFLFAVVLSCCWGVVGFSVTVLLSCCWVVVGLVLGGWIVVVVGVVVVVVIVSDCCRVVAVCVAVGFQQGGRPPRLRSCIRSAPFAVRRLAMDVQCPICKADEFHRSLCGYTCGRSPTHCPDPTQDRSQGSRLKIGSRNQSKLFREIDPKATLWGCWSGPVGRALTTLSPAE